jgi:hypothetical protein
MSKKNSSKLPQFEEDYNSITEQEETSPAREEPQPIDTEAELKRLQEAAVSTLKALLRYGSETTRLRACFWLLNRADKLEPVGRKIDFGELRIGFDEEDYKDDYKYM